MTPITKDKMMELGNTVAGMVKELSEHAPTTGPIAMISSTAEFVLNHEKLNRRELALLYATAVSVYAAKIAEANGKLN